MVESFRLRGRGRNSKIKGWRSEDESRRFGVRGRKLKVRDRRLELKNRRFEKVWGKKSGDRNIECRWFEVGYRSRGSRVGCQRSKVGSWNRRLVGSRGLEVGDCSSRVGDGVGVQRRLGGVGLSSEAGDESWFEIGGRRSKVGNRRWRSVVENRTSRFWDWMLVVESDRLLSQGSEAGDRGL